MAVCDEMEAEQRIDVGIALLEPSADIRFSAPTGGPVSFLTSLSDIPGDLVDFYTDFGFHVRRGWQTLQRNVGAENFFSGIASYLPRNKIDDKDDKADPDDPKSPYSINYSGEFNKNQGYSYVIQNKNGNQTGYVSFPDVSQSQLNTRPNDFVHNQTGIQYDKNKDSMNYGNIVLYSAEHQTYEQNMNYQRMKDRLKEKQEQEKQKLFYNLFKKYQGARRNFDTQPQEHNFENVYPPTYEYIDYYY